MRSTTALLQLALCLSSVTTLASAWPEWLPDVDAIIVRADDDSTTATATAKETTKATETTDSSKSTITDVDLNTAEPEETGTETGTETGKGTGTATNKATKTKTAKATHTSYPYNSPAGGVEMLTPATTAVATPLYKVGDYVTWGWNYTSLLGTPTAVDVLISCSTATKTWTLTSNMTFETNVNYVWNTNDTEPADQNLLTEMYTLIIKDSDAAITEVAEPGYLGVYSGFTFGLYTPQRYVPWDEWECIGCNAGSSGTDRRALGLAVGMSVVTVLSFTWFVTGLGLQ